MKKYVKNAVKSALSKPLRGRRYRRLLSISVSALLSISTFLTVIPQTATTVYADQSNKTSISGLCTGAITSPVEPATKDTAWSGSYVWYGSTAPNKYRVLTTSTTTYNDSPTMLLDCDTILERKRFDDNSSDWAASELNGYLNGDGFLNNNDKFTVQERNAIAESTVDDHALVTGDYEDTLFVNYVGLGGEKIFVLDYEDVMRPLYGYYKKGGFDGSNWINVGNHIKKEADGSPWYWWLRSRYNDYDAGIVAYDGNIEYSSVVDDDIGVSPAFNINLSSVIFSSLIPDKTNEYKLTVKDTNMTIAQTGGQDITRAGNVVTVPYTISGTKSGEATQVSVLLTDSEYSSGTVAITGYSYQKLNVTTWDTSGTGTFTLPAAYANKTCGTDYYAYILAEDVNGTYETDYASTPVEITIPSKPKLTITAKDKTYQYNGQNQGPGDAAYADADEIAEMVMVEGLQSGDTLTSITVDGQGKEVGDYDLTPSAAQVNGSSASDKYDVTYVKGTLHITSDEISYTVRFKVKNGEWNNGSKDDVTVTLTGNPGDTLKLSADQIPAVGSKPDDGFKEGNWDTTPSTETAITKDTTYTYTYVPESAKIYTVTATDDGYGSAEPNPNSGTTGTKVTITATADDGYDFKEWKVIKGGVELADSSKAETSFNIKDSDVEVKALFEKKTPEPGTYTVTAYGDGHGDADADPTSGKTGTKVTITATADKGYEFKEWKVIAGGVDLADKKKASTTFNIKESDVEVKAVFEKNEDDDDHQEEPSKPAVVNPDTVEGYFVSDGQPVPGVAMGKTVQGVAAQAVFNATRPAGFLQAFTFNMAINGKVDYTPKNGTLTIIIPKEFQKAGRTFAIMALDKNGRAWTYADTDTNPATVTATINVEGYAFALIYKD